MIVFRVFALVLVGSFMPAALPLVHADQGTDGLGWLGRIVTAAQTLNYTGTFVYSSGNHSETSRITHLVDATGEREKLEVLDGSPREVVRFNNEVKCFLPGEHTVFIDQSEHGRAFPARISESLSSVAEYYRVRMGEIGRVAGRESQLLILEPKDDLRYGHLLWADTATGLLLRARMVNERGDAVEQFVFTDVTIGGNIDKEKLKAKYSGKSDDWKIVNAKAIETRAGDSAWVFKPGVLPGFQQGTAMRRQLQTDRPETWHVVFSDGLAAVSVFIEPIQPDRKERTGVFVSGPFNVYKRPYGEYMLTVLGEVPPAALKKLGDSIEPRRK